MAEYKVEVLEEICKGCTLCVTSCPNSLFKASCKINSKGYKQAEWIGKPFFIQDAEQKTFDGLQNCKCIGCGVCYNVCPEAAIKIYRKSLGSKVVKDE